MHKMVSTSQHHMTYFMSVVAHVNGVSVTSSSLCTNLIAGTAVATSAVLDYQSTKQVIFVFPVCKFRLRSTVLCLVYILLILLHVCRILR